MKAKLTILCENSVGRPFGVVGEHGFACFIETDAGNLLYREAIEVYGTVTGIKTIMRDMTDEIRGHVRVVMASQVACPFFDDSLRDFHKNHPKTTFALDAMASEAA